MKKKIFAVYFFTFCLILTACDPPFTKMEIIKYPDRIIYIAGVDKELDLTGGEVQITRRAHRSSEKQDMDSHDLDISHSVNFDIPGVYVVTLKAEKAESNFIVQVVEPNFINDIVDNLINESVKRNFKLSGDKWISEALGLSIEFEDYTTSGKILGNGKMMIDGILSEVIGLAIPNTEAEYF